jgi:hypothetical protein
MVPVGGPKAILALKVPSGHAAVSGAFVDHRVPSVEVHVKALMELAPRPATTRLPFLLVLHLPQALHLPSHLLCLMTLLWGHLFLGYPQMDIVVATMVTLAQEAILDLAGKS